MTDQEQIMQLAEKAWGREHEIFWFDDDGIERFAELVAAAERDACAKVCENVVSNEGYVQAKYCAAAIRARGDKHD